MFIGEWWLSDVWAKAAPATCGGRKTSDYIGTFNEKSRRPFTVAASMPPRIGRCKAVSEYSRKKWKSCKIYRLFVRENSEFSFGGNLLSLRGKLTVTRKPLALRFIIDLRDKKIVIAHETIVIYYLVINRFLLRNNYDPNLYRRYPPRHDLNMPTNSANKT